MPRRRVLVGLLLLGGILTSGNAHADGPWKGLIVDAETGTPLDGVVVLAAWVKYTASVGGWAGGDFVDAEEVVTRADGRFFIPAHSTFTILPWKQIRGELVIFKPGYGHWAFRGGYSSGESVWKRLESTEEIVELPRLRSGEERLKFYERWVGVPPPVPLKQVPRLRQAIDAERVYLGLGKMYETTP